MDEHRRHIAAMFDRVAPRYDRLNRIISFGTDLLWRRRAVALCRLGPDQLLADVGAGTGDLSARVLARSGATSRAVGIDPSAGMLETSRRRLARFAGRYRAVLGAAEALPLRDATVDRVISGFTLRNVSDLGASLREARRILRPGGVAVLLELSHPTQPAFSRLYRWYFEAVVPPLAIALGGDAEAYRYLPRSLRPFPSAEGLAALMTNAGFIRVRFERLTGGIAAIHVGEA